MTATQFIELVLNKEHVIVILQPGHDQLIMEIMEITELRNSSKNKRIGTELTKSKYKARIKFQLSTPAQPSSSAVLNIISNTPPCLGAAKLPTLFSEIRIC